MEVPREQPPDYEQAFYHPENLRLPAVPRHDPHHVSRTHDITLPALSTVLSSPQLQQQQSMTQMGTRGTAGPQPYAGYGQAEMTYDHSGGVTSRKSLDAMMMPSPDRFGRYDPARLHQRSTSALSMEDPDVRIAAEALSGLSNPGTAHASPAAMAPVYAPIDNKPTINIDTPQEPEPLLELLTQAHPWVGGAVNGSLSAYSTTKNHSPRVVQYGANLIERNIGHPMVNTVSSVGRMTGVESGLRWYLDRRRPSDVEAGTMDISNTHQGQTYHQLPYDMTGKLDHQPRPFGPRRTSSDQRYETLPAYRASGPPSYREEASPAASERAREPNSQARSISSQLFIMTSGLGVALSETSRQSLHYCVMGLGQATEHIRTVTDALKLVLEQYDQAREYWHKSRDSSLEKGERPRTPDHDQAARRLAEIIKKHSDDIWRTLKDVVNYVSNTAGGALPENARHFVRNQLLSLPQRWRVVRETQPGENDTSGSAHRMIAFATEGLDMMSQVSHVCKATLDSADLWLQRVGSRRANSSSNNNYNNSHHYATEKLASRLPPMMEDEVMRDMA